MQRIGIVGYGFAGRGFHAYLIRRVPGLQLAAAVARSPDRRALAAADGIPATYASLDELLGQDDIDTVVLATPHDTHLAMGLAVLRAGKNLVIDKPMCLTAADADALIAARDQAGVLLTVFHNRRWDWDYLTVREALASHAIGEPYLFETAVMRHKTPRGWRADSATGGGLIFDWGAHLVDQALALVPGPVLDVSCEVQRRGWGSDSGSYARIQLRFASGVLYAIEIGNLAAIGKPRWYILGEEGALIKQGLDPQEPAMLAGDIQAATETADERARIVTVRDGMAQEQVVDSIRGDWTSYYENLADALAGRAPLAVSAEEARRVVAVLEAATMSAAGHCPVAFEDVV